MEPKKETKFMDREIAIMLLDGTNRKYRKKPIPIRAIQVKKPFKINTKEGVMNGKEGDYLVEGIHGELYICDQKIFDESYEVVK